MKYYSVEIYRVQKHGQYKANYGGIAIVSVEAKNKKEAREIALANIVGEKLKDYKGFPIDHTKAPEYEQESKYCWVCRNIESLENHIITFEDVDFAIKNKALAIDVIQY